MGLRLAEGVFFCVLENYSETENKPDIRRCAPKVLSLASYE